MSITAEIQKFIVSKINRSEVFQPFFKSGFKLYYGVAPENPALPYLRYIIQRPVPQGRDLQMDFTAFECSVTINIVCTSLNQLRALAEETTRIFDGIISDTEFPNIEDVVAEYPEESQSYDAETSKTAFESAQTINFNFVK